jgi:glucan phosphoethanolaminetransferase (alkaline phosphatase superfamily)
MLFDSSAGSNNKGLIRGFMYFSDHGEDPSRPRNLLNQAVLEQIVGVPLVLRLEGGRDQQQWMQQINTKQNTPFMTDNLVYLLADMMGLQGKSLDQTRNLASTQYQIKDRYTIHQDLNFDGNSRGCWVRGF